MGYRGRERERGWDDEEREERIGYESMSRSTADSLGMNESNYY
jgi:hypothetical protein